MQFVVVKRLSLKKNLQKTKEKNKKMQKIIKKNKK